MKSAARDAERPAPDLPDVRVELLASSRRGDGSHGLLRLSVGGSSVVIKHYGGKRSLWRTGLRHLGHRWIVRKTSMLPHDRLRTEQRLIELWLGHGYDVPRVFGAMVTGAHWFLVLEDLPGPSLRGLLRDRAVPEERKLTVIDRLAQTMSARHERALELREPGLVHERPSADHILLAGERLVTSDLEVASLRRTQVPWLVSQEIAGFLRALIRTCGEQAPRFADAFVRGYGRRDLLARVPGDIARGPLPGLPWIAPIERHLDRSKSAGKQSALRLLEQSMARVSAAGIA